MIGKTLSSNMIAFVEVLSTGENFVSVRMDNGTRYDSVPVYGTVPSVGQRVPVMWDAKRNSWKVVGIQDISGSFIQGSLELTDFPSYYGQPGQMLVVNEAQTGFTYSSPDQSSGLDVSNILVESPLLKTLDGQGNLTLSLSTLDFVTASKLAVFHPLTMLHDIDGTITFGIDTSGILEVGEVLATAPLSVTDNEDGTISISINVGMIEHSELAGLDGDDHVAYATADGWSGTLRKAHTASRLTKLLTTSTDGGLRVNGGNSQELTDNVALTIVTTEIVDDNRGLSVVSNKVGINLATVSGLEFSSKKLQISDDVAGDSLTIAAKVLNVNQGYSFTWTGNHTWNTGTARFNGTLLVDTNLQFVGAQSITTTLDTLTLQPAGDLILDPGTNKVTLLTGAVIQSDNYDSQTTGMRITHNGQGDFRYLYADEMHVKSFIADLEQALAGGQIIAKSVAKLAQDFTIPAYSAQDTLIVESFAGFENAYVFQNGDTVALRVFNRGSGSSGSLTVAFVFGTVTYLGIDTQAKTQSYTFTRLGSATVNGLSAGGTGSGTVSAGTLALDFGVSANGYYEVSAIDGLMAENSPYAQVVTWGTHPWYDRVVRGRMGNLKGIFPEETDEYGLYAGSGTANTNAYLRISNRAVELRNLPFKIFSSNNTVFYIDPLTPSMALGSTAPTGYTSAEAGFWMGKDGSTYKVRIGDADNYLRWDGTTLYVAGNIDIKNPGSINTSSLNNNAGWTDDATANTALAAAQAAQSDVNTLFQSIEDTNAVLDGKIVTYFQTAQPAGASEGDLWFDTDDGNKLYIYQSSAWTLARDTGIATAITNAAAAQSTADSKITTFYGTSTPTALAVGDLWWNTSNNTLKRWNGTTWVAVSVTNTNQLTDGAGLGNTALWGSIENVPSRFGDAPSGSGLYLTATHMGYYNVGTWTTYMDDAGYFFLKGAPNHALTWNGTTLTIIGDIQAKYNGVATLWLNPVLESLSIGADAQTVTYDSTVPGIFMGKRISTGEYTFRVGNDTDYIRWDGSTLEVSGKIVVRSGDFEPAKYRPALVDLGLDTYVYERDEGDSKGILFSSAGPYVGQELCGQIIMDSGDTYMVRVIPGEGPSLIYQINCLTTPMTVGERRVVLLVRKTRNGGGGLDNPKVDGSVYLEAMYQSDWLSQTAGYKALFAVLGYAYLSSDFNEVISISYTGKANTAIITSDYISIPNLSVIGNADMGHITAGDITIASTNGNMWFNVNNDTLKLAIGGFTRTTAPFRVYDDGAFFAGDSNLNTYLYYTPSTGLTIRGNITATSGTFTGSIYATSGTLSSMQINGNLTINTGALWFGAATGYGVISASGMIFAENNGSGDAAIYKLGIPGTLGFMNVDMFANAASQWRYAFSIKDGGNDTHNPSSLFHAESGISGNYAADRLFNASTSNGSSADGFYATIAGGSWNTSDPFFSSKGAGFKAYHTGGGAAAAFNQNGFAISNAPVVWASSNQVGRQIFEAQVGAYGQTAFKANNSLGTTFTALDAGFGALRNVGQVNLKAGIPENDSMDVGTAALAMYFDTDMFGNIISTYLVVKGKNGSTNRRFRVQLTEF